MTASRARLKTLTFTDDKEGLREAIQRSSLKLAAHDLFQAPAKPLPACSRPRTPGYERAILTERSVEPPSTTTSSCGVRVWPSTLSIA